jgi:outer membrane cobalamin receptor
MQPEEAEEQLDNIVVTGSRATDQLSEIPHTASVIRLDELEARNAIGVPDALRQLPGVHVVQPSGQGGVARVFIRGGDQNLTMILLDGIRVNDPTDSRGSAFDFSTVNLNDVERIEIVRGPQSAVYGSDALSGVINIISKEHTDEFGGSLWGEAGSDSYRRGAIDLAGPIGESGGFSLRAASKDDGEPVEGTTFESDMLSGRLSLGANDTWNLRLFGSYSDSEGTAFPEDSGGADLAVIRDVDTRSAETSRLGLTSRIALSERWDLNILAASYDHDAGYFSPGIAPGIRDGVPPNGADSKLDRTNFAVNAVASISDALTATFGLDYYDEKGRSTGFIEFFPGFEVPADFVFDRDVTGAFGELHYSWNPGSAIMASVRRDNPSTGSAETTSRVGILHTFNEGRTSVRANWGQGFALPSFFSLSSPLVGDPDLKPETSESYDLGLTHHFSNLGAQLTVALFRNEFVGLIDFEDSVFRMINRPGLDVDGVEIQFDYAAGERLSVHVQATYLDLELVDDDEPLRQRPDWRAGVMLRWLPSDRWLIDASWMYAGETFDSSVPTGDQFLDGYDRLDLTATWSMSARLDAVLSITNLLDAEYYEAIGFPAAGTRARLGVRYGF